MVQHHIQRHIISELAHVEKAHFSQLRPKNVDSNIFTYHLKQLITEKLVAKQGVDYALTPEGKRLDKSTKTARTMDFTKAYSVVFVAIKSRNGYWLLRKRLHQPLYGKVGFVHSMPRSGAKILDTAKKDLEDFTGISADVKYRGSGFVETCSDDGVESFLNFTVVYGETEDEKLEKTSDKDSEYMWVRESELPSLDTVPSLTDVIELLKKDEIFFKELKYRI